MIDVRGIYEGSDGEATKALYVELEKRGAVGRIAVNLFRAQKCSERAKAYRGGIRGRGSYRSMAYERKNWALSQLCAALMSDDCGFEWGWQRDESTPGFEWVLYIDLPQGQVSFHSASGLSPRYYKKPWDGVKGASPLRIVAFVESVLNDFQNSKDSVPAVSAAGCSSAHQLRNDQVETSGQNNGNSASPFRGRDDAAAGTEQISLFGGDS